MSVIKKLLVQSKNRTSGSAHSFNISIPGLQDATKLSLISASIPNTLYNINEDNNTIYWTRSGAQSATLSPGAYSVSALVTKLATVMEAADPTQTYNVSYSETTMKITITCTLAFGLTCTNTTNAIWVPLRFDTSSDKVAAVSQVGDYVLRLDFPPYLLISVSEFSPVTVCSDNNTRGNFIVCMDTNSQYIQVHNHKNSFDNLCEYSARNGINNRTIWLLQPDGSLADLNGGNWAMLIQFEYCY